MENKRTDRNGQEPTGNRQERRGADSERTRTDRNGQEQGMDRERTGTDRRDRAQTGTNSAASGLLLCLASGSRMQKARATVCTSIRNNDNQHEKRICQWAARVLQVLCPSLLSGMFESPQVLQLMGRTNGRTNDNF